MEQTARLPDYFHPRMIMLVYLLICLDLFGIYSCINSVIQHGPSMAILFGNELNLLLISLISIMVRYTLNSLDLRRGAPWEHRSVFLFYYDFVIGMPAISP